MMFCYPIWIGIYTYEEQWQPKNIPVFFRMYQLNLDGNDEQVSRKYWDMYENDFVENIDATIS